MASSRLRNSSLSENQQSVTRGPLAMQEIVTGDRRILRLRGELDLISVPALEEVLSRMCAGAAGATSFVLDLSGVSFLDSSGLRVVLEARDLCLQAGCEFRLVPGPRQVQRVFEIAGLESVLSFQGLG